VTTVVPVVVVVMVVIVVVMVGSGMLKKARETRALILVVAMGVTYATISIPLVAISFVPMGNCTRTLSTDDVLPSGMSTCHKMRESPVILVSTRKFAPCTGKLVRYLSTTWSASSPGAGI